MREHARREWQPAAKRTWVTPVVRDLELTDDVLRLFGSDQPTADALDACDRRAASLRRGR
jgi:hypothetical protein